MDFLDPKLRKKHIRRLYLGYILVGVAIGLGALILLFASFGYGVDTKGNVFQNGLVFLASTPDAAQVKIHNQDSSYVQTVVTSDRLELKADSYNFQFLKQGYKPWQRTVAIRGGSIERLVYPFLVPEKLTTTNDELYASAPGLVTQSPDKKTIVVQQPDSLVNFQIFDSTNTTEAPQIVTVPTTLFADGAAVKPLQLLEWSTDNRHILVRYDADSGPQFIVIDRQEPAKSRNLNEYFGITPTKVLLRDKNPEHFYMLLDDKRLMTAEIRDKSMVPVAEAVLDFKSHGDDNILYVTTTGASDDSKVVSMVRTQNKAYRIRELPRSDQYVLDLAQYSNQWYIVVGAAAGNEAFVYREPVLALQQNNTKAVPTIRTLHIANPQTASFSGTSRFIAVESGQNFMIFDAEKDEQYRFTMNPSFDDPKSVRWMDGHRLMGTAAGKVLIFDFDGTNQQTLSAINPGSQPMFTPNFDRLSTIAPVSDIPGRYALTSTSMRVE